MNYNSSPIPSAPTTAGNVVNFIGSILGTFGMANPAVASALTVASLAAKYGPGLIADLESIFTKHNVTQADLLSALANPPSFDDYLKAAHGANMGS